jgi:hypothetical protein
MKTRRIDLDARPFFSEGLFDPHKAHLLSVAAGCKTTI